MASINNSYPETYKIELVKRYLNGEMQKKIVKEHNIAKSTFYSWVCKYSSLILQKWKIGKEVEVSEDNTFVDIRRACETSIKTSVVQGSKSGKVDDQNMPERLYRKCEFVGNDIWHILHRCS